MVDIIERVHDVFIPNFIFLLDFVQVAQEVFKYELKNMNNSQGAMYISAQDITDFTEPPQYNPDFHQSKYLPPYDDDSEQVRRERDELQRENDRLRVSFILITHLSY